MLSPATVKTHVNRAMIKLGARDRAHLVVFAYEAGLVRPGWTADTAIAVAQVPAPGRRRGGGPTPTIEA